MGLFSSILGAIPVVGDVIGAASSAKATKKASAAQQAAAQAAIDEQRRQFDTTRGDLMPFVTAGQGAIGQISGLLGLNGNDAQGSAISALKASPLFQSLFNTGQEAILQNASATGGLRGGNTQESLAGFGRDTLSQVIQQQLSNLFGVSSQGSGVGTNVGQLGANAATQIGSQLNQQGAAKAGGILGVQSIYNNLSGTLNKYLTNAIGGGIPGLGSSFSF